MVLNLTELFILLISPADGTITECLHVHKKVLNSIILYPCINKIFLFHNRMNFDRSDNDKMRSVFVLHRCLKVML